MLETDYSELEIDNNIRLVQMCLNTEVLEKKLFGTTMIIFEKIENNALYIFIIVKNMFSSFFQVE